MSAPSMDARNMFRIWCRGFSTIVRVFGVAVVPIILTSNVLQGHSTDSWPYLVIMLASMVVWLVCMPLNLGISEANLKVTPEQVKPIAHAIDATAALIGTQFEDTYLGEVDRLLASGKIDAARKLLHDQTGVTWDQAQTTLMDWHCTVLVRKLEMIQRELQLVPTSALVGERERV